DVWFSESMLADGNIRLLQEARRRGLTISLDINFDPCWSTDAAAEIARRKGQLREVLPFVDMAHGNIRELCEFTESPDLETALSRVTAWGAKAVVIHMGADGAAYFDNRDLIIEAPDLAQNPVNSTGTGDVLSICMILLHDRKELSMKQKLQLSNRIVREFME